MTDPEILPPAKINGEKTRGRPFEKGNPGGPGRPKGSRHKINEAFLRDFYEAWEAFGRPALLAAAWKHPEKFVQIAASLLPKEFKIEASVSEMTDEQLASRIRGLADKLGDEIGNIAGVGDTSGREEAPVRPH